MSSIHEERMRKFVKAGLYLVTSEVMSEGRSTLDVVRLALSAGVRLFQLREKHLSISETTQMARDVRRLTADAGALLIINDNIDIAIEVGADGVHLGQDDLPIKDAVKKAPDMIIGASSHSVQEALDAQRDGASYVNIGPLFPTKTKTWTSEYLGTEGLKRISSVLSVPYTVMGGIKGKHLPELKTLGVNTVAVVTAVTAAKDPERAASDLLAILSNSKE